MWHSIIPSKMYNKWVKDKWIVAGADDFISAEEKEKSCWRYIMNKKDTRSFANSLSQKRRLEFQGFDCDRKVYMVECKIYDKMKKEVNKWYDKVFDYVIKWLESKNYIKLKSGNFRTGFCAEVNPDHEVVKQWGAPLMEDDNKVAQIKEKFGEIVVYFMGLEKKDRTQINKFAKLVEKKFDCCTRFW